MRVLVTGGAGYIGSHTLVELDSGGFDICSVDSFANSAPSVPDRVDALCSAPISHKTADIRDADALNAIFEAFRPDSVIHFAALKAVGASVELPLDYYDCNIGGLVTLLTAMDRFDCRQLIFSSSAAVYGAPHYLPIDENHPCLPDNPYGRTKLMGEAIIKDWAQTNAENSAVLLRYFNPAGAHPSGRIGEHPNGTPNNLMPYALRVAMGQMDRLSVFGGDYDTADGTGLRDYIHVVDLARAHVAALTYAKMHHGVETINVGTGEGATVLQVVRAIETASTKQVAFEVTPRRAGDVAASVACTRKAETLLNWRAEHSLADMCSSGWVWQVNQNDL